VPNSKPNDHKNAGRPDDKKPMQDAKSGQQGADAKRGHDDKKK
jgi:hypothetical protein